MRKGKVSMFDNCIHTLELQSGVCRHQARLRAAEGRRRLSVWWQAQAVEFAEGAAALRQLDADRKAAAAVAGPGEAEAVAQAGFPAEERGTEQDGEGNGR